MLHFEPYQQRVIAERDELADRLSRLTAFIDHDAKFDELEEADQILLRDQRGAMTVLLRVLDQRVDRIYDPDELMVVYFRPASATAADPLAQSIEMVAAPLRFFDCDDAARIPEEQQQRCVVRRAELLARFAGVRII